MWESFGFIIAFAYSSFICTSVKLYILTGVLVLGIAGYLYIEYDLRKSNKFLVGLIINELVDLMEQMGD